jgi:DNA-directed RNA polymerase specialized sigma subunit
MKEINYKDYEKLINQLAGKWYKRLNIELSDAIGQANISYCYALRTFDETKGLFSTHLYSKIVGRYKDFYDKEKNKIHTITTNCENTYIANNDLLELQDKVSPDACFVLKLVIENPENLISSTTKRLNKQAVAKYLKLQNWSLAKIKLVFREIKKYL